MMGQRQREQVQRGCAVGTVVLLAWLCRVLPLEGLPSGLQEACGILRSLLYLSLFAGWGISLYNRTVHPQVRRLLLNVDLLMLFWIIVRTLRFQLNTPPGFDKAVRGWGLPELCSLIRRAHKLYSKYHEEIERECDDDEFMAMFERFPEFDDLDDKFVEGEEGFTSAIAHYVDEHLDRFCEIEA